MRDDASLGMLGGPLLNIAHDEPGGARGEDHVGRQDAIELPKKLLLELHAFGPVLLDEVDAGYGLLKVRSELQV